MMRRFGGFCRTLWRRVGPDQTMIVETTFPDFQGGGVGT
jgi:hypothetical protein